MAIYIHIPFCRERCIYCDFTIIDVHNKTNIQIFEEYSKLVIEEIKFYSDLNTFIESKTLYLGGGTPSLIGTKNISIILEEVLKHAAKLEEITIEANPEDISEEFSKSLRKLGITRVSLGIQSMVDKNLKTLSRQNTYQTNIRAIKTLQDNNITNINCDIIFDIPDSTDEELIFTLENIVKLNVPHISAYGLTVEKFTPLNLFVNRGTIKQKDNFEKEFLLIHNFLEENGFIHYEISNYAKPNFESKHNLAYWKRKQYIGLGISACGFINNIRYQNELNINKYKDKIKRGEKPISFYEEIDTTKKIEEIVMLGFRLREGFTINEINKIGKNIESFLKKAKHFENEELLKIETESIVPTLKGWILSDYVIQQLISVF
ncbi:MAG: radical SAM family heme chaperone HemW [Brevinematia bacterium]